jgi:hypothetical protein
MHTSWNTSDWTIHSRLIINNCLMREGRARRVQHTCTHAHVHTCTRAHVHTCKAIHAGDEVHWSDHNKAPTQGVECASGQVGGLDILVAMQWPNLTLPSCDGVVVVVEWRVPRQAHLLQSIRAAHSTSSLETVEGRGGSHTAPSSPVTIAKEFSRAFLKLQSLGMFNFPLLPVILGPKSWKNLATVALCAVLE